MSERNETHAEIIAEVRFHAQQNIDAEKGSPTFGILTMEGKIAKDYADRLDAAHKRECGNAAKLREACGATLDMIFELQNSNKSPLSKIVYSTRRKINAALSAPPRNCDRFGTFAQAKAEWWKTEVLPRVEGVVGGAEPPFAEWLLLPATGQKGENDGSK